MKGEYRIRMRRYGHWYAAEMPRAGGPLPAMGSLKLARDVIAKASGMWDAFDCPEQGKPTEWLVLFHDGSVWKEVLRMNAGTAGERKG